MDGPLGNHAGILRAIPRRGSQIEINTRDVIPQWNCNKSVMPLMKNARPCPTLNQEPCK